MLTAALDALGAFEPLVAESGRDGNAESDSGDGVASETNEANDVAALLAIRMADSVLSRGRVRLTRACVCVCVCVCVFFWGGGVAC